MELPGIYVSPAAALGGNGTFSAPFATLDQAKAEIRTRKLYGTLAQIDHTVYLRGGVYELSNQFLLEAQDSGTSTAPIKYMAYPGEKPIIIGGKNIPLSSASTPSSTITNRIIDITARNKIIQINLASLGLTRQQIGELNLPGTYALPYMAKLPTAAELTINGKPLTLARYPNENTANGGYIDLPDGDIEWGGYNLSTSPGFPNNLADNIENSWFTLKCGGYYNRAQHWTNVDKIHLQGYWRHGYADQTIPVERIIDNGSNPPFIVSAIPSYFGVGNEANARVSKYYAYNILEELDAPGEYYIDRDTMMMYFYPPEDGIESMYLSLVTDELIRFNIGVNNIVFKDISIAATRGVAIFTEGYNLKFENCSISGTGATAVELFGYNNIIENCHLSDVNGGILTSGGVLNNLTAANNIISSCVIERFSRLKRSYNAAVRLNGVGNIVRDNIIRGSESTAIQLYGNEHIIEYNEIYDVCQNTEDMGAVYMGQSWVQRGSKISSNYIHDIGTSYSKYGNYGVFLDDQFSGVIIEGNVFENIPIGKSGSKDGNGGGSAVFIASGKDNIVNNNIMVNARPIRFNQQSMAAGESFDRFTNEINNPANTHIKSQTWRNKYPALNTLLNALSTGGTTAVNACKAPSGNIIQRNIVYNPNHTAIVMGYDEARLLNDKYLDNSGNIVNTQNNTPAGNIAVDPTGNFKNRIYYLTGTPHGITGFQAIEWDRMKKVNAY